MNNISTTNALKVHTSIGGSRVTVQVGENWERYVDSRVDARYPSFSFLEAVRSGRVVQRDTVHNDEAPVRIMEMAMDLAR